MHVHVIQNKNPRKIMNIPSVMLFKTVGVPRSKVCAIFPQEVDEDLLESIGKVICHSIVITRAVAAVRSFFKEGELSHQPIRDFQTTAREEMGGMSPEVVAEFAWGHLFCHLTSAEWLESTLDSSQHYHLAYIMEMTDSAIRKFGAKDFPQAKGASE